MGGSQTKDRPKDESTTNLSPEVNFEDFEVLRAIGKGTFGKVLTKSIAKLCNFVKRPVRKFQICLNSRSV